MSFSLSEYSKVTWYGHFSDLTKIATSATNMTRSPANLHRMVYTESYVHDVLKVKVKVKRHVIWTLFWFDENRYFYHKHDSIATNLAQHSHHTGLHPGCAQGQGQGQKSRDTDTFLITGKSLLLPQTWLESGSPANLHTMVPTWACIQGVLKVKVEFKGHVIRALLWCHEMFAIQYLLTFCLYMHSLYEAPLQVSSTSVRQLDVMSTSWNELLRHWRSG